jgi:hypothetical protein
VRADVDGATCTEVAASLCPQSNRCSLRQCTPKALCQGFSVTCFKPLLTSHQLLAGWKYSSDRACDGSTCISEAATCAMKMWNFNHEHFKYSHLPGWSEEGGGGGFLIMTAIFVPWLDITSGPRPLLWVSWITLRHATLDRAPWASDQSGAETSKWQHTTLKKRQISIPQPAFEPTIPPSERLQTHTWDLAATGIDNYRWYRIRNL